MISNKDIWFADQVMLAHMEGKIPHGPELPDRMPWPGDFFVLENEDGTDTLCVWWESCWEKVVEKISRPKRQ